MMSDNKILTVSYGTFSCTLEGFEDSFGTMKAIAEYFRDLAAEDRYFGAEPPQPDAEMLARIAEREITRRVEAHEADGKIVLSVSPEQAVEQADQADSTEEIVDTPTAETATSPVSDDVIESVVSGLTDSDDETMPVTDSESGEATPENSSHEVDLEAVLDEVSSNSSELEDISDTTSAGSAEIDTQADASANPETDDSATSVEAKAATAAVAITAAATAAAHAPDSIADKLERIRAVVDQDATDEDSEPLFEDEHAENVPIEEPVNEIEDTNALDAAAGENVEDAAPDLIADDNDADAPDIDEEDVTAILAHLSQSHRVEPDSHDNLSTDTELKETEATQEVPLDEATDLVETEAPEAPAESDTSPRARVIKVKRAELEAALADGRIEEIDENASFEQEEDASPSTLSSEEEADLQAELAAVAAEVSDAPVEAGGFEEQEAALEESDVSRLMEEADSQLEEPEGTNRRNAFQHLKAAAIAKKTDQNLGDDTSGNDEEFRSDLEAAIVPRRPEAAGSDDRSQRPAPEPLKLVAEQRVDTENAERVEAAEPIQPRRVAQSEKAHLDAHESHGFAEYAEQMGAHSLPEVMEAAAAYLSFEKGREHFSRVQLMNAVKDLKPEAFNREDSLRSFGQLLRTGKIEKQQPGQFSATGDIGYRRDERAAG